MKARLLQVDVRLTSLAPPSYGAGDCLTVIGLFKSVEGW